MTIRKSILTLLCLLRLSYQGYAQEIDLSYFLPQEKFTYRSEIPTPRQFFGFELGEQHLNYDQVVAYMQALAQLSPRMTLDVAGYSYQRRPLIFVKLTSPDNHKNLEQIRTEHLKLSKPTLSGNCNTNEMPAVVWLGYSVHGNETSAVHASVVLAYFFAAAEGDEIDEILKYSVILIHPALNPDGVNRFATWINANRSYTRVTDPNSREFREPLPSSRTNHYWFDLNRDWIMVQMPESQARMAYYYQWRPTMVNDYHEHLASPNFYFSPGVLKQTHNLIPSANRDITMQIAQYHAKELDKIGTIYYTKEDYDSFYPGKGSCLPNFHGAIGILYEQPSPRGFFQERADGLIRSFTSAIRNHAYCSYSAIRAAIALRTQLLNYTRDSYKEVQKIAKSDPVQGYVFGSPQTRYIDQEFFKILEKHQIEVYQLNKSVKIKDRSFEKEYAFVIPSLQDDYRLLKVMMEKKTDYIDSMFYDVSSWTLPLAFNLHYAELNNIDGLVGARVHHFPEVNGFLERKSDYAYVFDVHEFLSLKLICKLQEAGIRLKTATKPFRLTINGTEQQFDYGAIALAVADQFCSSDEIYEVLQRWVPETKVTVYPVFSSFGIDMDLGSNRNFLNMKQPKAAIIYGAGANYNGVGSIWHLFDQRLQMPLTLLENTRIDPSVLARYNTIILYGNYEFSTEESDHIKAWHEAGGNIIAIGESWEVVNKIGVAAIQLKETFAKPAEQNSIYKEPVYLPYSDLQFLSARSKIPGVILECRVDRSSPIGFGIISSTVPVFRTYTSFFRATTPYSSPVSYLSAPLMSGCISEKYLKQVSGSPAVLIYPRLVYFADDPAQWAYWFGTMRLFLNALFFPL